MEFGVLGPLEVTAGGRSLGLAGARARAVLAMLLVHANQVVSCDQLIEELWPGQPRAADSLQVRLSELRKALRSAGEGGRLVTRPPGYLLRVTPGELDALRFEQLAAEGNAALAGGDATTAARRLDEALRLWRGPALAGLDNAPFARAAASRLEEERLAALESRAEALLACGRHRDLIAELETLTAAHPLRERFWLHRMLALYRAGRQAEALRAYGDLRAILIADLAIEPGADLRDLHARILRQEPGLDARTPDRSGPDRAGPGDEAVPPTRYAQTDDGIHVAYQVIGEGERDIVFVPGLMSHLELLWEDPETADFFRRLAKLGRLIMFDKRDTGLSDRAPGDMSLEERMEDVRAVMRATGSRQAVFFGYSEGAPMSILFAATCPERVTALILGSASARWFPAPGYPCGQRSPEIYDEMRDIAMRRWGQGATIEWYLQSRANSEHARQLFGRFERMAISPSAFLRMLRMIRDIDVRAVLPAIHVPTLVIQRLDDRINPPCHGRYLAAHIAGARYFGQPGDHSLRFAASGDSDALCAEIAGFLASLSPSGQPARVLATILRARAVGAGRTEADDETARHLVRGHRGRLVRGTADSLLATFDAPGQAIRCAAAMLDDAAALGVQFSAGIHTGEVDLVGDDIAGMSVQIADQVGAQARPSEILVSRTVKDLVTGSGISFTERGSYHLNGEGEQWPLFAVILGLEPAHQVGPDFGDAAVQVVQGAGVVDHDIGNRQPLLPAGLGRHPGPGLIRRHAAQADQPLELQFRRYVHHDHHVETGPAAALGQQGHVVHDDGAGWLGGLHGGLFGRLHPLADQGVHDLVELGPQPRIAEHDLPQPFPVQRAVRPEHLLAEHLGDPRQPGRPGDDHFPGGHVRVDEHGTVVRQPPGYFALARPDASGEPHPQQREPSYVLAVHGQGRRCRVRPQERADAASVLLV
jgi:DNA-binding SARP family transcriptional activator/pimeloyl-ACP methyl ester carboxylesterase